MLTCASIHMYRWDWKQWIHHQRHLRRHLCTNGGRVAWLRFTVSQRSEQTCHKTKAGLEMKKGRMIRAKLRDAASVSRRASGLVRLACSNNPGDSGSTNNSARAVRRAVARDGAQTNRNAAGCRPNTPWLADQATRRCSSARHQFVGAGFQFAIVSLAVRVQWSR